MGTETEMDGVVRVPAPVNSQRTGTAADVDMGDLRRIVERHGIKDVRQQYCVYRAHARTSEGIKYWTDVLALAEHVAEGLRQKQFQHHGYLDTEVTDLGTEVQIRLCHGGRIICQTLVPREDYEAAIAFQRGSPYMAVCSLLGEVESSTMEEETEAMKHSKEDGPEMYALLRDAEASSRMIMRMLDLIYERLSRASDIAWERDADLHRTITRLQGMYAAIEAAAAVMAATFPK